MNNTIESRRRFLWSAAGGAAGCVCFPRLMRAQATTAVTGRARSIIYVFLSGGLAQHESFDLKPDAAAEIRGEFLPIATATPGIAICEHLPRLAARSRLWSLVRSLGHSSNDHSLSHQIMLSGCSETPREFDPSKPGRFDSPSLAALVGSLVPDRDTLPPAIVLPEKLIHTTGRVIPGQLGGLLGPQRDPYFLTASRFNATTYGAWPEYGFHHARGSEKDESLAFTTPDLHPVSGVDRARQRARLALLGQFDSAAEERWAGAGAQAGGGHVPLRERAVGLLQDPRLAELLDVTRAAERDQDRYGRNTFGWSLLLARRLVREGVRFVQTYLGNNETWDTHGNAFPHLKDYLLPPLDRALAALLDDLEATGELAETLIVVAGEFGRTPKISTLPSAYRLPGRDHWGAVQSVLLAGGCIQGGRVIGASDAQGGHPVESPQRPENLAATMFAALGFARTATWQDFNGRPQMLYRGEPIPGLT